MKTKLFLFVMTIALVACAPAKGETSDLTSTILDQGNFYGLVVNGSANVILSQGDSKSIRVEGDRAILNQVKTVIQNGALIISGSNDRAVTIYITVDDINMIEVNGSARVYANQLINSDMLLLRVNGNGSIRLDVRSLSLGMIVKGNGKIIVSGSTGESFARVYGSGNIFSQNLDSFRYTEEVNNGRSAWATEYKDTEKRTLKLHQ